MIIYVGNLATSTFKTRIIGPHTRTLEFPLLVGFVFSFFFLCASTGNLKPAFSHDDFPLHPGRGILGVLAIISVLTVSQASHLEELLVSEYRDS